MEKHYGFQGKMPSLLQQAEVNRGGTVRVLKVYPKSQDLYRLVVTEERYGEQVYVHRDFEVDEQRFCATVRELARTYRVFLNCWEWIEDEV